MKINYIKTIGFRKFEKQFETELYDVTNISGRNRSGKSNVLYAIINIMLGTNLSGDEKACLINKKCDASYGELHFTDNNGINHILVRGKDKYNNKKNIISLDGKAVTQAELTSFYKDKKLFLSIINPLYFLSKKPAEQKEMVDKYISDLEPNSTFMNIAYNNLSEAEQKILEGIPRDIPQFITELNGDIKRSESVISNLDGKIEYAQNIVNEEIPKEKIFEKDEELSLAKQELSFLNSNQAIVDKEKQKKIIEKLENEILNKETEFNNNQKKMQEGKIKYLSIKSGKCTTCPTCNQQIQDESKLATIENMRKDLVDAYDDNNKLLAKLQDLRINLSIEKCKYHSLEGDTSIEKTKRISVVEESITALEKEKMEVEKFNNAIAIKSKAITGAKSDIKKFNLEKASHNKCIENLNTAKKIAQKLYISYIEEKMKLAKQHLKDVDIKFYSVLKGTGEIKEDFIITYKNQPLSDLSRSETIATALEFANMFNKIAKTNFPIFIDDYESCADYDFIEQYSKDTQLIVSKVEKGTHLKISDANSNKVTTVKPIITKVRTINTYKNNADLIPKAA